MFVHANKFVAKTPTCSFHAQGHCQRGNSCKFAHDAAPVTLNTYYVEQEPIQRSGEQCRFFLSGSCIKGNKCTFVHEVERKPIQNHKADSDTNTKLEDVRNKGLGNLGNICVFFLRGVCTKVNCPFLHPVEQDELEPFEAVKAHQSVHIEELKSNERTVLGLTRCVFGAGAEVLQVITNPRSLLFQTKGMIGVSEGEILAILSRFGTLKSFEYKQDGDSATTLKGFAKASFESIEPTKAAMEALKNTPHAIEFVTDVLKRKSKSGDVTQTRYLKAQWFGKAPHVAYAHFRTRAAAERAVQFCQGNRRYLSVTFQRPTPHQRYLIIVLSL